MWRRLKQLLVFPITTLILLSIALTPSPAQALVLSSPGEYPITLYATFDNQTFTPINGTLYFYPNGTVKASFTLPDSLVGGYPVSVAQGEYYAFNTGGNCYWVYYYTMQDGKPTRVNVTTYTWDANSNYIIFQAPITGTIYIAREQGTCSGTLGTGGWFVDESTSPPAVNMNVTFSDVWSNATNVNATRDGYTSVSPSYTSGTYTVSWVEVYSYNQSSTNYGSNGETITISVSANTTLATLTVDAWTSLGDHEGVITGKTTDATTGAVISTAIAPIATSSAVSGSAGEANMTLADIPVSVIGDAGNNIVYVKPGVETSITYTVSNGELVASNGNVIHVDDAKLNPPSSRLILRVPYYLTNITSLIGAYSGALPYIIGNTSLTVLTQNNVEIAPGTILAPHLYDWSFDGKDDYILVANSVSLDVTNAISIGALIYPLNSGLRVNLISKNLAYRMIRFSDNKIYFQLSLNGTWAQNWLIGNTTIQLNSWTHIVETYDSSLTSNKMKIYVNGTLDAEGDLAGTLIDTSTNPLDIGYDGYDYPWDGYIAFIHIYNRALSINSIDTSYTNHIVNASGLVLFLDPTFYNGATYLDLSPYHNDGTPYDGVARVPTNQTWLWVVENARNDSLVHLDWFPVGSKVYFYQNGGLVKTVDIDTSNETVSLPNGNYTVRAFIPAPYSYTPISLDKMNETVNISLVGQAPMQPVGFDSGGNPLYKWAPAISKGLHVMNLSLGKWNMRLMADSPITLLGVSDTEGYLEVETHNTTLYIYVGDTGKPSSVVIDSQPAIEGTDWGYNSTGRYVWVHVPSSIVRLEWATSSSGGGGGGIVGPAPTTGQGKPVPSLPPVTTSINAKAVVGLLIIIGAVLGSSLLGSYRGRGRLHDRWVRRLERELNKEVKWKRRKKWWE